MFTYKFVGLTKEDCETPYYYGSLRAKPELGHILFFHQSGNRYAVVGIAGEGLEGEGPANQQELAWAEINRGEEVPTLVLQRLIGAEIEPTGRSFTAAETKEYGRKNRETRLSASAKK